MFKAAIDEVTKWGGFLLDNAGVVAVDLLLTSLLLYPLLNFLRYGWVRKEEEIRSSLTKEAQVSYFRIFQQRPVEAADAANEFNKLYVRLYGRRRFVPAILFVLIIALVLNFALGKELLDLTFREPAGGGKISTVVAAIAGAYMFVAWDFFGRLQRRCLTTADVLRGALRLAIAVPMGMAFSTLLAEGMAPFTAFGIGVFPLETVTTMLRRLVNDKLGLQMGSDGAPDQVTKLSGVDRSIADRIQDADITTITQLAWTDPIQLMMRSSLSFDYVMDLQSQALAWTYFDTETLTKLRLIGLRGAYEIRSLMDRLNSGSDDEKTAATGVVAGAAAATGINVINLKDTFSLISVDGSTTFIYETARN